MRVLAFLLLLVGASAFGMCEVYIREKTAVCVRQLKADFYCRSVPSLPLLVEYTLEVKMLKFS